MTRSDQHAPWRIFLGLTEVAGYYDRLSQGFVELGCQADVVTLFPNPFGYEPTHLSPRGERMHRFARRLLPRRPPRRTPGSVLRECVLRVVLFCWALPHYDAYVFGFRNTFFAGLDLPVLRLLGKPVVCVFHGSDSRPAYLDGAYGRGLDGPQLARLVRSRRRVTRVLDRWSTASVSGPLTAHLHGKPIVVFQRVGVPSVVRAEATTTGAGRRLRVLHAPSDLAAKGTDRIREVVAELQTEGIDLDYVEVTGRPHTEVLAEIAASDLVIDQLYSDTSLAGLATEAASFGVAAVVGGYELDQLDELIPSEERPPGFFCHPDDATDTVRRALVDHDERARVGAAARRFVAERWAPVRVAERFLRLLDGDVPADWLFDPATLRAVHGAAIDEAAVRARGRSVLEAGGPSALGVDDKPAVRRRLEAFFAGPSQGDGPGGA